MSLSDNSKNLPLGSFLSHFSIYFGQIRHVLYPSLAIIRPFSYIKFHHQKLCLVIGQALIIAIFFSTPALAWFQEGSWRISGYFKNASSWRLSADNCNDLLKCENIFQIEPHYRFNTNVEFCGIFRAYYDAVFDLERRGWTDNFRFKEESKIYCYPEQQGLLFRDRSNLV